MSGNVRLLLVGVWLSFLGCMQESFVPTSPSKDPCAGPSEDGVLPLCVWASDADLTWIHENPKERVEIPADVTLQGEVYTGVELEVHGGLSRTFEKKSYRLRFAKGERPKADFFEDREEETERLVLQASWIDPTWARAKLAMDLTREAGGLAPRIGHVQVYLNGRWNGLYLAIERIDEHYLERQGLDSEPLLYKAETHDAGWLSIQDHPLRGFDVVRGDPKVAAEYLISLFKNLAANPGNLPAWVDRGDWEAWHMVMSFAQNSDTFTKNYYLYKKPCAPSVSGRECRARIIQWDADATFGNNWDGNRLDAADPEPSQWFGSRNHVAGSYFRIPRYRSPYLERYRDMVETRWTPQALAERMNVFADRVRSLAERDLEKWQPHRDFDDEVARLRVYFGARHRVITQALSDELVGASDQAVTASVE